MGRYRGTKICINLSPNTLRVVGYLARKLGKSIDDVITEILEGLSVSVSRDEIIAYLQYRDSLAHVKRLYEEFKEVKDLLRMVSKSFTPITVDTSQYSSIHQETCRLFIDELASNGLLTLVKKHLSGVEVKDIHKLLNDDAFYMIELCRDIILSSDIPEGKEVRRVEWVI
jgi:hypothetical protein